MAQTTAYGKQIKIALLKKDWTVTDLAREVNHRTGLFCDQAYLSHIMAGRRAAPKIKAAINEILELDLSESA